MQRRVGSLAPQRLETFLTRCASHIRMNFYFYNVVQFINKLKKVQIYDLIVVPEKIFVILPGVSSKGLLLLSEIM